MNLENLSGVNVVLPNDYKGEPVEVVLRTGYAPDVIPAKSPVKIAITGTIAAPLRWIEKRAPFIDQVHQERCYVIANRENMTIVLITNEKDDYESAKIAGKLEIDPIFDAFGINTGKQWIPEKLGEFFKMNRAFFLDKGENMSLVSNLKNFVAKVNNNIERKLEQNGSKADIFSQEVDSNMPKAFNVCIPIFKGEKRKEIEIELCAHVDGRTVSLSLISPEAQEFITNQRDNAIDDVLNKIHELAPGIVIIEQ